MAGRKRQKKAGSTFGVIVDFAEAVDTVFERLTGKTVATWLKEFQQPKKLPQAEQSAPQELIMLLADAYAVLGLKPDASPDDVKKHYRNLAMAFHSDKGSAMNDEAMKLLNKAFNRITKGER